MKRTISLFFSLVGILVLAVLFSFGTGSGVAAAATTRSHPINAKVTFLGPAKSVGVSLAKAANNSITRVTCNGSDYFVVESEDGQDPDCFAYAGTLGVSIYYTAYVFTGNNTGYVIWDDGAGNFYENSLPSKNRDYWLAGGYDAYRIDTIHIN